MKFIRRFTKIKGAPYDDLKFVKRSSTLRVGGFGGAYPKVNVLVPETWSREASDVLAQHFMRKGSNSEDQRQEQDARQVFHRLAGCWTSWGKKLGYFDTTEDAEAFFDEARYMLAHQIGAPSSTQWQNTGLHFAYGCDEKSTGPDYYYDQERDSICQLDDASRPQTHGCFIQAVNEDSVRDGSHWAQTGSLLKSGSGTGANFSSVRAKGELMDNGVSAPGLLPFLDAFDHAASALRNENPNRRCAKQICLNIDHPDVIALVRWKAQKNQNFVALEAGSKALRQVIASILEATSSQVCGIEHDGRFDYDVNPLLRAAVFKARQVQVSSTYLDNAISLARQGRLESELAILKAAAQGEAETVAAARQTSVSINVPKEFIQALDDGDTWDLRGRIESRVVQTLQAQKLWNEILHGAWSCGNPTLLFESTINDWHTCAADGPITSSNPGSEFMFLEDTACTLATINLLPFLESESETFDSDSFRHAVRLWTVILDISVEMASFKSAGTAKRTLEYRPLGLNYANLGSLLMRLALPYGSKKALAWTAVLTSIMTAEAYRTSSELAKERGAFPRYEANHDYMSKVIRNHYLAAAGAQDFDSIELKPPLTDQTLAPNELIEEAMVVWQQALALGEQYGYRNAQVSVVAPTGLIGQLMDCETTGLEPLFALVKLRTQGDHGYQKTVSTSALHGLRKLGYSTAQIDDIIKYCLGSGSLDGTPFINRESLMERGFSSDLISRLELDLVQSFDLGFVFSRWNLGRDFCLHTLGLSEDDLNAEGVNILRLIGYSAEEIRAANSHICGALTFEGAPHIIPEHLAPFNVAKKQSRRNMRTVSCDAHLATAAAAQPFVSGGINKSIQLPFDASLEDFNRLYRQANSLALKSISISREEVKYQDSISPWRPPITMFQGASSIDTSTHSMSPTWLPTGRRHKFESEVGPPTLLASLAKAISVGLRNGVPIDRFVEAFGFGASVDSLREFVFRDLAPDDRRHLDKAFASNSATPSSEEYSP